MPLIPDMSPAAIGWMVVSRPGDPVAANRSPMPRRTASGQPSPDDELTVTTAPSGIRAPASVGEITAALRTSLPLSVSGGRRALPGDRHGAAAFGGFLDGERDGECSQAVDAVHQRTTGAADRCGERLKGDVVEVAPVGRLD